jgi:poly(beta-D-mannuronate) lyase
MCGKVAGFSIQGSAKNGRRKKMSVQSSLRWRASERAGESSWVITLIRPQSGWLVCLAWVNALLVPLAGYSEVYFVDSLADLTKTVKLAAPGDVVTLKNGVYTTTAAINVRSRGTTEKPITIAAETIGGVEIAGSHGFAVTAPAEYVVISGFVFTHASGKSTIGGGSSHVRFTRNTFQCQGDGAYLSVTGDDVQVDHCLFRDKKTTGSMIAVGVTNAQVAQRFWIHHNHFHDYSSTGATGGEMLRVGVSATGASVGNGVVEYNLFERCRGENDLISNRSSGNTFRYNTFLESPTAQFTLRHGNVCVVYGNILRNTEGLRIYGDRHVVFSNYFEGNYIGINLGNGSVDSLEGTSPSGHERPDNCILVFNTLVDNRTHYQMSRRSGDALGATNTTFAHNILQGGVGAKIEGPYADPVWTGNMLWKCTATDLPAEGGIVEEPLLVAGADGIKRPQAGSPAIGFTPASFVGVVVDFDGQPRPENKTIGADEISDAPAVAHVFTGKDVGPLAHLDPSLIPAPATPPPPNDTPATAPEPAAATAPTSSDAIPPPAP